MNLLVRLTNFITGAAIVAALLMGSKAGAATLTLIPSSTSVTTGQTFSLDLIASGINLGGYQLEIGFEPGLVSSTNFAFDALLGFSFQDPLVQNLDSLVIAELSLSTPAELLALQGTAPNNSFRLGTFSFKAENAGDADFTFLFSDLTNEAGAPATAQLIGASVNIQGVTNPPPPTGVPEPSAWSLGIIGLGAMAVLRRR